jgi:hypothetical protein
MKKPEMSVETVKDNSKNFLRQVDMLTEFECFVGVPSEGNRREDSKEFGNAAIGYINEHGSPANNIPARPHLSPGVASVQDTIAKILGKVAVESISSNDTMLAKRGLSEAGIVAVGAVKQYIVNSSHFTPLAPATIAARESFTKRHNTAMRESPLIFTGSYVRSITYVIRKKGETKNARS